ncbi:pyruvate:ferredoxin (flavodoxin) oxidoreductase [Candidatus Fermentibacteria bacterium]|nr:pyruvate:ferredoxin (flavodoxin) oxidoreductase [Candidatus Fermentibacteria bacterium]
MEQPTPVAMDGNSAASYVAHSLNEVIAIYPITPSSGMGEIADERSAAGLTNIWGNIPHVVEMQSEAGAAAAVHGVLATGALSTTFTASQGLLLMVPTMFKIAGELLPVTFHVTARSIACQALSIFGDHSDVMAVRSTGFALLASGSVQEVMDLACIATAASLEARVPFVHFFDGFRTSHEINTVVELTAEQMRAMIDDRFVLEHRGRGLSPDHPMISGTSQNPDVYFQGRETVNPYYAATPGIVARYMEKFTAITGREYRLFDYYGHPEAERVIILMGSGAEAVSETVDELMSMGHRVGVVRVHLYRPFSAEHFVNALPATVKKIAVLDRTKEPGALGEPLYLDVRTAIGEALEKKIAPFGDWPLIVGGRYGLSSKEFTPGMVAAVFDNLRQTEPQNHFTVGIDDDVSGTSLPFDSCCVNRTADAFQAMFYGLGSDGTVGANKNSIKIIQDGTGLNAQAYFVYDSKKAGSMTVSHLRFGKKPIRSTYLCNEADFIGCHNFIFLEKYDMLGHLKQGGTFLLNAPFPAEEIWDAMPRPVQQQLIDKKAKFFTIDANEIARKLDLGVRINTTMQAAFFKISGVLPQDTAVELIRESIEKTYKSKGPKVVEMNLKAVDEALESVFEVHYPDHVTSTLEMPPTVPDHAPDFVKQTTAKMIRQEGDTVKVSEMPADGKWISATTQYEKRNVATDIPVWAPENCIQCGICSIVCPHAAIRLKVYDPKNLEGAPETFKSIDARGKNFAGMKFTVQVAPEDCTGCGNCIDNCPPKEKALHFHRQLDLRKPEAENFSFFLSLPETDPALFNKATIIGSQLVRPLFEFSGACAGCGETPYVKLLTQLFGDRAVIANATGCSSIYGGNLPTTPYAKRDDGLGPAWTNSLFEDAAEVGLGFRLTMDKFHEEAARRLQAAEVPAELKQAILDSPQSDDVEIAAQRKRVAQLKELVKESEPHLYSLADYLVKKSVWSLGGDGWAYDIGYGGLDHVIASGRKINLMVLDTEVYSNTGGQMSKSTPRGATAKFAVAGKPAPKKDLGMLAMTYGNVYVAKIALGANQMQAVRALTEAESYPGSSIVIAYSHCIAHGIDMGHAFQEQKKAVASGHWILFRFDPRRIDEGKNPLQLDSKAPSLPLEDYMYGETRFRTLQRSDPERAAMLLAQAKQDVLGRYHIYKQLAEMNFELPKDLPQS